MSRATAKLFSWLQGADFYRLLYQEALEQLPPGDGRRFLDVGCGPGLLTRLAASRGYRAVGVDSDPDMVRTAEEQARERGSSATFRLGTVADLRERAGSADVVAAASLLAVLADKEAGLRSLWSSVRPGGTLLIVEPTDRLSLQEVRRLPPAALSGKRAFGLRLWAWARGGRTVRPEIYRTLDRDAASRRFVPLLQGLVGAWILERAETDSPPSHARRSAHITSIPEESHDD